MNTLQKAIDKSPEIIQQHISELKDELVWLTEKVDGLGECMDHWERISELKQRVIRDIRG